MGEKGFALYRREVAKRSVPVAEPTDRFRRLREFYAGFPTFAAKYAAERLAIIDGDVDRLVEPLGGDLSSPHQFVRVAEAMIELGPADGALAWARRGIAVLSDAGDVDEVVELRRHHHECMPCSSTYSKLQTVARTASSSAVETYHLLDRDWTQDHLAHDVREYRASRAT